MNKKAPRFSKAFLQALQAVRVAFGGVENEGCEAGTASRDMAQVEKELALYKTEDSTAKIQKQTLH